MSLSETQEIFQLLTQIDKLLADIELKINTIQGNLPQTREALLTTRETLRLTTRLFHLFAHMNFPPNIQQAMNIMNKMIFTVRALYVSMKLLESTTLYGQIMGVIGVATLAVSGGSMLEGY